MVQETIQIKALLVFCNMVCCSFYYLDNGMIHRRNQLKTKTWIETFIDDYSLPEKMITILWGGMPYLIWMMADGLEIWIRVLVSIGVWLLLSLLCSLFGNFMSSGERHWN